MIIDVVSGAEGAGAAGGKEAVFLYHEVLSARKP